MPKARWLGGLVFVLVTRSHASCTVFHFICLLFRVDAIVPLRRVLRRVRISMHRAASSGGSMLIGSRGLVTIPWPFMILVTCAAE